MFLPIDISASDSESEQNYNVEETVETRINPYWYEVTDDEDDEERQVVVSHKEKLLTAIQERCDELNYALNEELWTEAKAKLVDVREKIEAYRKKYEVAPRAFLECLQNMPDLAKQLSDKTKQDFANKQDFISLKALVTMVAECNAAYSSDVVKMEEEDDEEAAEAGHEEDKEATEEDHAAHIQKLVYAKDRKKARIFQSIASACKRQGFIGAEISALGLAAVAHLDEDSQFAWVTFNTWQKALEFAQSCFDVLQANPTVFLAEDFSAPIGSRRAVVPGSFCGLLKRLHVELLHIAQFATGHKLDYLKIPDAENRLAGLTDAVLGYYLNRKHRRSICTCSSILIDILGFRRQEAHALLYPKLSQNQCIIVSDSVLETVKNLSKQLSATGDAESRMRGICYIAYQLGLAGKYREGRDLLLRSGASEAVEESIPLSILYNRVIAILGLVAFEAGDIPQAYQLLGNLWAQENHEVLIGQSMPPQRVIANNHELELEFRDRLVPPHLRIPFMHMELAAMLSALAIDSATDAKNPYERSRHQKYFYQAINKAKNHQLLGEPSQVADQVAMAHKALKVGNYFDAKAIVEGMSAWSTLPRGGEVLEKYLRHLKEAALRIFCFTNRRNFSTFSVSQLALKYELEEDKVKDIMNHMVSENNALIAFWDCNDEYLYVDRNNTTHLQHLVVGAADYVSGLAPFTESRSRGNTGRGRGRGGGRGAARGNARR